ncbi:uncharacterized protein LOC143135140 isoform X2 [Alosa pseudoharengus]|uniref:uncharacterized protein LOC143135140 isoform X2 n=1 Tax=Alosa pseudoharengus TaxID=34774 RepID=UPI003F898C08
MDITAAMFLCLLSCIIKQLTGEELKRTVEPGENITLACSTTMTPGSRAVWIKLCSGQPSQVITQDFVKDKHRLSFIKSKDKDCFNLLITNITESDACVYCNGNIEEEATNLLVLKFGRAHTKLIYAGPQSSHPQPSSSLPDQGQCWVLMVSMCVVCSGLSALTASICCKTGSESQSKCHVKILDFRHQREQVTTP